MNLWNEMEVVEWNYDSLFLVDLPVTTLGNETMNRLAIKFTIS
jgi:hypothetical protein